MAPLEAIDWRAVEAAIGQREAAWTDALAEFCAIPSEGGRPDDLERASQWTAERLERMPMAFIGAADLHGNAHAPDESFAMATAGRAALAFLRLLDNFSRLPRRTA